MSVIQWRTCSPAWIQCVAIPSALAKKNSTVDCNPTALLILFVAHPFFLLSLALHLLLLLLPLLLLWGLITDTKLTSIVLQHSRRRLLWGKERIPIDPWWIITTIDQYRIGRHASGTLHWPQKRLVKGLVGQTICSVVFVVLITALLYV